MAPAGVPAADVLPGDAELAGNLGLGAAGGKQLTGLHADVLERLAVAQAAAEALRRHGVKAVLVAGVGHFLMLEAPDRFNRLLGEVIEEFRS